MWRGRGYIPHVPSVSECSQPVGAGEGLPPNLCPPMTPPSAGRRIPGPHVSPPQANCPPHWGDGSPPTCFKTPIPPPGLCPPVSQLRAPYCPQGSGPPSSEPPISPTTLALPPTPWFPLLLSVHSVTPPAPICPSGVD
ncbi:hypothetical protein KIL84_012413 [Mauremys mutica]|uniref:Uncharacterized protein n=1 Tax=Mauremys mutica TaxID=74926 RepID=A0A9D4BBV0_9SAUR|nr:hypothetical protein KIL84_012413 [Mauremys mutica]